MKKNVLQFSFLLVLILCTNVFAQSFPGAPAEGIKINPFISNNILSPAKTTVADYSTTVYTFGDVAIFSYFDETTVSISDYNGTVVGSATIKADTIYSISPGAGIYSIAGNKPYSVLIGDAISSYVNGYFALDQGGRGTSTKLNTWMMLASYDPHFIIFAYNDSTGYTIKDLATGGFIYAGTLNNGEYLDFPDVSSISQKALQVVSDKPVSALSYTDQDYYVPSANGTFAGTLFYGFSGIAGYWTNSITITSYAENNYIKITDLNTKAVIDSFTLGLWQVRTHPINQDTFWKVESTGRVTAANIPFAGWTGSYYYMARAADSTGNNFGTAFIVPTIASTLSIFSYEDDNLVHIDLLGDTTYPYTNSSHIADTTLQKGKAYIFNTLYGNYVYRISSNKNVSVLQSNGGAGADFMPLNYTLDLTDISVATADINFAPSDNSFADGDQIQINVTVRNNGTVGASDISVYLYDGDPDAGSAPPIGNFTIPSLPAGGNFTFTIPCIVPQYSQYHFVYAKIDPANLITEFNESNNKAARPFRPNADLQPPLAVVISAPSAIQPTGAITDNSFKKSNELESLLAITSNIFNIGTSPQTNVNIKFHPQNGLVLVSGPADTTISSLPVASSVEITWTVSSDKDSSGYNLYSLDVASDSAAAKEVKRVVIVLDNIPPVKPAGLSSQVVPGYIQLNWTKNAESDLGGYKIYYGTDGVNYNGTGAKEGNSPVTVSTINQFSFSGLPGGTYYFKIKAYDVSNNESDFSDPTSITITSVQDISAGIPTEYALYQNYPNPFNPTSIIRYALPSESRVTIKIYNLLGQEIKSLVNSTESAGYHEVTFNAANLASGIYFYRISATSINNNKQFIDSKKLLLIK